MSAAPRRTAPPRRTPVSTWTALVPAALLVAVAVVAVRDLVVSQGWSSGTPWVSTAVDRLDGLGASTGLAVVGGAVALLGVVLLLVAVMRGRRTHLPVTDARVPDDTDVWLTPDALGELAHEIVDRTPGVVSADVRRAGRRKVVVETVGAGDPGAVVDTARAAVEAELGGLTPARLVVRPTTAKERTS